MRSPTGLAASPTMARAASAWGGSAGLGIAGLCLFGFAWRYCFAWRRSYRICFLSHLKVVRHDRGCGAPHRVANAHTATHLAKTWSRWFFVLRPFYCYVASVALLLMRLSEAFKQGGVRAMFWRSDVPFLMILFFTHVFRSNMSYVVYHWLFEWGGVSESSCDSGMCRPWLVSVTVGVDLLVNWEILKASFLKDFPLPLLENRRTRIKRSRRTSDEVRRALCEAWRKTLKHWNIDCE